jgi:hypothetical protein
LLYLTYIACVHECFLVQVAAAGTRELWLAWIDALIAFEGSLGRSGLLGCYWEVSDARDLPVLLLLRGSTLSVFGEDPAWLVSGWVASAYTLASMLQHLQDAWLEAELAAAAKQALEAIMCIAFGLAGELHKCNTCAQITDVAVHASGR